MAINSLEYSPPVRRSRRGTAIDYELLEAAVNLAEEGRHSESLTKTFEHLLPGHTLPNFAKESFSFIQGSSEVRAKVDGDDIVVTVPLVKLPPGGAAIAALRYVLTSISATGQIYQPRLRGDEIELEFRDALSRFHPAKLVEVLRRMPNEADHKDDYLIEQFGGSALGRAGIAALDEDELKRCEAIWKKHWAEIEDLLKECQRKRSMFFLNELTAFAYYRIAFSLPLGGLLNCRLSESADTFNDSDEDPMKREAALGKCVKEMKAVSSEVFRKSLGHASYAISPLDDGTPSVLSSSLGDDDYIETIQKLAKSAKAMDATLALTSTYTFLLARYSWEEPIEVALKDGLAKASGKPWREAANILLSHAAEIDAKYGDDGEDEEEDDDGEGGEEEEEEEEEESDEDE